MVDFQKSWCSVDFRGNLGLKMLGKFTWSRVVEWDSDFYLAKEAYDQNWMISHLFLQWIQTEQFEPGLKFSCPCEYKSFEALNFKSSLFNHLDKILWEQWGGTRPLTLPKGTLTKCQHPLLGTGDRCNASEVPAWSYSFWSVIEEGSEFRVLWITGHSMPWVGHHCLEFTKSRKNHIGGALSWRRMLQRTPPMNLYWYDRVL